MSSMLKKVLLFTALAAVMATFVAGCGQSSVAKVNGRKITRKEYYDTLERLPYADQAQGGQSIEAGALVLQRLITEELLLRLADKDKVAPTEQQIKDRIAQAKKQPGFSADMKKNGITNELLKERMRVEQAAFNLQTKGVTVTPDEIKKVYDANRATAFTIPEQVYLAAIFVTNKADADKAMNLLKTNVEFGTVARTMSKHPSAKNNGRLAPLARGAKGIPTEVQNTLFNTPKGRWTNPINAGNMYIIFQVLNHVPQKVQSLADVQNTIRDRLMLQKGVTKNTNLNEELAKFRETAKVECLIERYKPMVIPPKPEKAVAPAGKK